MIRPRSLICALAVLFSASCAEKRQDEAITTEEPAPKKVAEAVLAPIDAQRVKGAGAQKKQQQLEIVRVQTETWKKAFEKERATVADRLGKLRLAAILLQKHLDTMKEEFGLLNGFDRLSALSVAFKMAHGKDLQREEMDFIRFKFIFNEPLKAYADAIADKKPLPQLAPDAKGKGADFKDFLHMTGQDKGMGEILDEVKERNRYGAWCQEQIEWLDRVFQAFPAAHYDQAIEICTAYMNAKDADVQALFYRGTALYLKGDREAGKKDLTHAVQGEPALAETIRLFD